VTARGLAGGLSAWLLAALLAWASLHKIAEPQVFAFDVFRYQLLPPRAVNTVAILLPWLELVTAVALVAGRRFRDAAALLALLMLAAFTAGLGFNLARGLEVACSCFSAGGEAEPAGPINLVRNGLLMLLALLAYRGARTAASSPDRL